VSVLGDKCYSSLIEDWHIRDIDCIQLLLSKLLGTAIVIGGSIVKIPQIITIIKNKSTQGLSLSSFLMETTAYLIIFSYNTRLDHPFNTYGEVVFMLIQNIIITLFIVSGSTLNMTGVLVYYSLSLLCFYSVPHSIMLLLYAVQIPMGLLSKIPQITMNYQNQSTGQLSLFSVLSYFLGTAARSFTTWTELDDIIMLSGNLIATMFNAILVFQTIYY
ncbi:hypothetical protein BDB01DRAFT_702421, partial [Pilobolus umbonatus]